jgi:hypothetical protein
MPLDQVDATRTSAPSSCTSAPWSQASAITTTTTSGCSTQAEHRRVDLLTGAFSSNEVHISEISILSSIFPFSYLMSVPEHCSPF